MCSSDFATVGAEMLILGGRRDRHDWVALHVLEDAQHRPRRAAQRLDLAAVRLEERHNTAGGARGLVGSLPHASEEEVEPCLPVSFGPDSVEQVVVGGAVRLEVETQVEDGFTQRVRCT